MFCPLVHFNYLTTDASNSLFLKKGHITYLFLWVWCSEAKARLPTCFSISQRRVWEQYLTRWWLCNPQSKVSAVKETVCLLLHRLRNHVSGQFSLLSVQIIYLAIVSAIVLFCRSCQKRRESSGDLIGFLCVSRRCMNRYGCTVLALSLVLCQGNMIILLSFYLVFSCSQFHQTVTKSHGVTANGSLYEPSRQGWIYSVTSLT